MVGITELGLKHSWLHIKIITEQCLNSKGRCISTMFNQAV